MLKRSRLTLALSFSAAVLCGCGSAAESAKPSPSAAAVSKRQQYEAAKADCMKQKGFKYVAYVQPKPPDNEESRKRAGGDYQAMRKFREKYGFGIFAVHVYPKEMGNPTVKPDDPEADPNWKITSELSEAQMQAYRKAMDTCSATAAEQVLGLKLKSQMDLYTQHGLAVTRAVKNVVNGDPKLVELAADMATCLKGKGHAVSDTTPDAMSDRGQKMFRDQEDKLGREQRDDVPDVAPPVKEGELPMTYAPTLTPEQAKPYLDKEIKAALDDLDCGKDFYPVFMPKQSAAMQQVDQQFGM
ncbi:hypothetical protein ACTMTI_33770 [Nonomuraea sp. H19]|uniref:hypothetical protein n=1 Tax=Nonomuraea sp. H19 TaxID=3452206 RepID=UPI003F8BF5CD